MRNIKYALQPFIDIAGNIDKKKKNDMESLKFNTFDIKNMR